MLSFAALLTLLVCSGITFRNAYIAGDPQANSEVMITLYQVNRNEIKNHAKNVELGEFVVMSNPIHGILILTGEDGNGDGNGNVQTGHIEAEKS